VARSVAIEVVAAPFHDDADIQRNMESFARTPNGGVVVLPDTATNNYRKSIIDQVARSRLPAVYPYRFFAEEGGLASYGIDVVERIGRLRATSTASFAAKSRASFRSRARPSSNWRSI
jgi:putative ABC transport system substrate-binding protein